jgi:hypothetical protein
MTYRVMASQICELPYSEDALRYLRVTRGPAVDCQFLRKRVLDGA